MCLGDLQTLNHCCLRACWDASGGGTFSLLIRILKCVFSEGVCSCLYFLKLVSMWSFCAGRYPGCGGGLPGLPPQAAALRSHQHRPHHPEGCQLCVAGGSHQRGHGEKLSLDSNSNCWGRTVFALKPVWNQNQDCVVLSLNLQHSHGTARFLISLSTYLYCFLLQCTKCPLRGRFLSGLRSVLLRFGLDWKAVFRFWDLCFFLLLLRFSFCVFKLTV